MIEKAKKFGRELRDSWGSIPQNWRYVIMGMAGLIVWQAIS